MMEIVSRVHASNLVSWAADKPRVLVLSADLTSSCEADLFRDTYPDRFISCGIAEQNMMSVAGGLCREGFVPLVHTFAVFIYRRAYDQIAMSVAYPNLPVKMFGFLPGIMTPGGATHQAIEDVAVMRALPNMTVLEVGDATEVESVLDVAYSVNGPVYVRMLRGEIARLFPSGQPMRLDCPRVLQTGSDITVVTSGICTEEALRAVTALKQRGVSLTHVHVSTLKPFNNPDIGDILSSGSAGIITMENHVVDGGLGTVVAEKCVELNISKKLIKLGLQDTFSHGASKAYLMKRHGLDAMSLIQAAEKLTGASFAITRDELADIRIEAVHSDAKAEAL
jgi:transketolase